MLDIKKNVLYIQSINRQMLGYSDPNHSTKIQDSPFGTKNSYNDSWSYFLYIVSIQISEKNIH